MTSLRLYKAWDPSWPEEEREATWHNLVEFAKARNITFLMGTQISCKDEADLQIWNWTKSLLSLLGPEHVMGLAIGNEMELLFTKSGVDSSVTLECINQVWSGGYFWQKFVRLVTEFDELGFNNTFVTTVFGGLALASTGQPFYEDPKAMVSSFLTNASMRYGSRFAFTFNLYPYFDPNILLDVDTPDQCDSAILTSACWNKTCHVPTSIAYTRTRLQMLTGRADNTLWIGETGWSSPQSSSLATILARCAAWSSNSTMQEFYAGFLHYDLDSLDEGQAPDHIFFFAARDSVNFGVGEHFGLVETCASERCKLRSGGYEKPERQRVQDRLPVLAAQAKQDPSPEVADDQLASMVLQTARQKLRNGTTLQSYDCTLGLSAWTPKKRSWCCKQRNVGCAAYDCYRLLEEAFEQGEWPTTAVRAWCCEHQNMGCQSYSGAKRDRHERYYLTRKFALDQSEGHRSLAFVSGIFASIMVGFASLSSCFVVGRVLFSRLHAFRARSYQLIPAEVELGEE